MGRLDEITGIGVTAAQTIIAEVGLDMGQFPTAGHLVSWAKLSPRTAPSGTRSRPAKTGKQPLPQSRVLAEAAASAARSDTFLGERYRRLVKRRGKLKAIVAVARSILVIVWHLLADPTTRYHDLGADYYIDGSIPAETRNLVHQLQALGHTGHPHSRRLNPTHPGLRPKRGSAPHPVRRTHALTKHQSFFGLGKARSSFSAESPALSGSSYSGTVLPCRHARFGRLSGGFVGFILFSGTSVHQREARHA